MILNEDSCPICNNILMYSQPSVRYNNIAYEIYNCRYCNLQCYYNSDGSINHYRFMFKVEEYTPPIFKKLVKLKAFW